MMGSPDLYWGWHMFTHESHICCRREASVMHNLEDLIGGHIMGAGPFLVAWRKDQTFLLVAYHLFFFEILNYSLSLYIYIYIYIYQYICVCIYVDLERDGWNEARDLGPMILHIIWARDIPWPRSATQPNFVCVSDSYSAWTISVRKKPDHNCIVPVAAPEK